jgi:hypothetical protein
VLTGCDPEHPARGVAHACLYLLAQRAFLHAREELADHAEVDVRLEQRHAHVAQRLGDVLLVERAHTGQLLSRRREALGQGFEHGSGA